MVEAQAPAPDLAYRTIETAHFKVTFPGELEPLGRVAARTAERAFAALGESFLPPPAGRIELLVTDHSDLSNGSAGVFPTNRIIVLVQPPLEGLAISHYDDWLEIVITHELAHIFHLDRAGPLGTAARSVFGRVPWTWPAFPAYTASLSTIEGVAVHRESLHTRAGRVHGSAHMAVVRAQALAGRAERVDQALGRSPIWPGGDRPYVFGSLFFHYLSDTYGEPAVVAFLEALAGQWMPYRLDAAARDAFGSSFASLWDDWTGRVEEEAELLRSRVSRRMVRPPELLTSRGRRAFYPVPAPSGGAVAYLRDDGRSDVRLVVLRESGERSLVRWNGLERPSWLSDSELLLPQVEFVDNYRVFRDLYRVSLEGEVTRLTRGLRVLHADPNVARGEIVAVLAGSEGNRLVVLSFDGTVLRTLQGVESGVLWSYPAWSPDGERIVAIRRRPGGWTGVVLLDAEGAHIRDLTEDRSLNTSPAWSPDGTSVLWSSDRSGIPNLYAAPIDGSAAGDASGRAVGSPAFSQVTDVLTAGTFPAVDAEGEWIYMSLLSDDGWEVARVPYDPGSWFDRLPVDSRYDPRQEGSIPLPPPEITESVATAPARDYSALSSLLPRFWLPIREASRSVFGTEVLPTAWGIRTSGSDLVGRHRYDARLAQAIGATRSRAMWGASYAWSGLGNPVVLVETGQDWSVGGSVVVPRGQDEQNAAADTVLPLLRERWLGGALVVRRRRVRSSTQLSIGARSIDQRRQILGIGSEPSELLRPVRPEASLTELRLSVGYSTARSYAFSVSTEEGIQLALSLRQRWDRNVPDSLEGGVGSDGAFREAVASITAFRGIRAPGYSNHVLAFRGAVGVADGPGSGLGHFSVGGGAGAGVGVLGLALGDGPRRFPVRGLSDGDDRGNKAWSATAEWRFPVALIHSGLGARPLYLDRIAGSLFVDVAGTSREVSGSVEEWRTLSSFGAELMFFGSLLFEEIDRVRLGVAVPLEGPEGRSHGASVYLQTGWSF